jgi:hypothetical protein
MAAAGGAGVDAEPTFLVDSLKESLLETVRECKLRKPCVCMALERVADADYGGAGFNVLQAGGPYILLGRRPIKVVPCEHIRSFGRTLRDLTSVSRGVPLTPTLPLEVVAANVGPQLMAQYARDAAKEVRTRHMELRQGPQRRVACVLTTDGRVTMWDMALPNTIAGFYNGLAIDNKLEFRDFVQGHTVQVAFVCFPDCILYALTRTGRVFWWGTNVESRTREDQMIRGLYEYKTRLMGRCRVVGLEEVTEGDAVRYRLNTFGEAALHNDVVIQYVINTDQKDHLVVFEANGVAHCDTMVIPWICMPSNFVEGGRVPKVIQIVTLKKPDHADGFAMLFNTKRVVSWFCRADGVGGGEYERIVHDGVAELVATTHACAILKHNSNIEAWGLGRFGGDYDIEHHDIRTLVRVHNGSEFGAFVALTGMGGLIHWGDMWPSSPNTIAWLSHGDIVQLVSHHCCLFIRRRGGETKFLCPDSAHGKRCRVLLRVRIALVKRRFLPDTPASLCDVMIAATPSLAPLLLRF